MVRCLLTHEEAVLIQSMAELGYGEMYQLTHKGGKAEQSFEISDKAANFIKAFRLHRSFSKVAVHDGEPTAAEREVSIHGCTCLKKFRF